MPPGMYCIVAAQERSRMATKYGRSNGSFHRVLACSAGGPGFDSRLRHNILRCSMERMQMALVKPLQRQQFAILKFEQAAINFQLLQRGLFNQCETTVFRKIIALLHVISSGANVFVLRSLVAKRCIWANDNRKMWRVSPIQTSFNRHF